MLGNAHSDPAFRRSLHWVTALKMLSLALNRKIQKFRRTRNLCASTIFALRFALSLAVGASASLVYAPAKANQGGPSSPVVVQPGAPGQPSKTLSPSTHATLMPVSRADVDFMQGMIMHHSQAIEMTALLASHTENRDLRSLGARISSSQLDEIKFMQRWLATRGERTSLPRTEITNMPNMDMANEKMALMPGMLTPEQMQSLRRARGAEFDRLFLTGMIQHHSGALTMVEDLFDTAGAGQDAEIFEFATDADNSQRAEIKIMQTMLQGKPPEEKR